MVQQREGSLAVVRSLQFYSSGSFYNSSDRLRGGSRKASKSKAFILREVYLELVTPAKRSFGELVRKPN